MGPVSTWDKAVMSNSIGAGIIKIIGRHSPLSVGVMVGSVTWVRHYKEHSEAGHGEQLLTISVKVISHTCKVLAQFNNQKLFYILLIVKVPPLIFRLKNKDICFTYYALK